MNCLFFAIMLFEHRQIKLRTNRRRSVVRKKYLKSRKRKEEWDRTMKTINYSNFFVALLFHEINCVVNNRHTQKGTAKSI